MLVSEFNKYVDDDTTVSNPGKTKELRIPTENFKAGHGWVNEFKSMYRIS